jgi:NAD(P)-dependent dehydrogenase (short-subunit alcohol dehydrogenase family)
MSLEGKVAIVTGGGTGIGAAVAREYAAAGAQVVIVGRRVEALKEVAASITEGPAVVCQAADVSDRVRIGKLVEKVAADYGRIDILVNNAGINIAKRRLEVLDPADWDALMAVNATGAFNMIHGVLPHMRARKEGLIINIASIAGVRPTALAGAAYNASKHALVALSTSIGLEEAEHGIRSSMIAPGEVNTPLLDRRPIVPSDEQRARVVQPEDIAAAALFIANLPPRANVPQLILSPTIIPFA